MFVANQAHSIMKIIMDEFDSVVCKGNDFLRAIHPKKAIDTFGIFKNFANL
jgi:hypothetical protein